MELQSAKLDVIWNIMNSYVVMPAITLDSIARASLE